MPSVVLAGMLAVCIASSFSSGTANAGIPGTANAGIVVAGPSLVGICLSFALSIRMSELVASFFAVDALSILIWNRSRWMLESVAVFLLSCVVDSNLSSVALESNGCF